MNDSEWLYRAVRSDIIKLYVDIIECGRVSTRTVHLANKTMDVLVKHRIIVPCIADTLDSESLQKAFKELSK